MNLKNILPLFILFMSTFTGIAQDYKENIKREFSDYLTSIADKDFEKSMTYISDEFFEIVPKEQMISLMDQTFNNPEVHFEIKDPKVGIVEDSEEINDKHYSLLNYSNYLLIKFPGPPEETREAKEIRQAQLEEGLNRSFGEENVDYVEKDDHYEVFSAKQAYAISANGETDWKFIVVDKDQKDLLQRLLPKEITEKIE